MTTTPPDTPPTDPCPDPLTQVLTVDGLADLLGIRPATLRGHIAAGTDWVPAPAGRINGGHVWRRSDVDLDAITAARRTQGQRRPRPRDAAPSGPSSS